MPYTKTNWQSGDIISSERLNHAEDGIAQAQQTADAANARDTLGELADVDISNPTEGQVVLYDATNSKWVNGSAGGGVEYINVFDATNNKLNKTCEEMLELSTQAILYCDFINNWSFNSHTVYQGKYNLTSIYKNGISYYFVFQRIIFEGYLNDSGKPTLKGIFPSSLEISDLPPTKANDGQMLKYDRTHSSWKAVNPTMSLLTDVSISSPTNGQVLKYDGSHWVNTTPDMSILTDTQITSPTSGQVLKYDGTKWVNGPDSGATVYHSGEITGRTLAGLPEASVLISEVEAGIIPILKIDFTTAGSVETELYRTVQELYFYYSGKVVPEEGVTWHVWSMLASKMPPNALNAEDYLTDMCIVARSNGTYCIYFGKSF